MKLLWLNYIRSRKVFSRGNTACKDAHAFPVSAISCSTTAGPAVQSGAVFGKTEVTAFDSV